MKSYTKNYKLQDAFEKVSSQIIDIHDYTGKDVDVVFEIITAESFIVGIAGKLLDGMHISIDEELILSRTFLDKSNWYFADRSYYSIIHIPEVLDFAIILEELKNLCLEKITR